MLKNIGLTVDTILTRMGGMLEAREGDIILDDVGKLASLHGVTSTRHSDNWTTWLRIRLGLNAVIYCTLLESDAEGRCGPAVIFNQHMSLCSLTYWKRMLFRINAFTFVQLSFEVIIIYNF